MLSHIQDLSGQGAFHSVVDPGCGSTCPQPVESVRSRRGVLRRGSRRASLFLRGLGWKGPPARTTATHHIQTVETTPSITW